MLLALMRNGWQHWQTYGSLGSQYQYSRRKRTQLIFSSKAIHIGDTPPEYQLNNNLVLNAFWLAPLIPQRKSTHLTVGSPGLSREC